MNLFDLASCPYIISCETIDNLGSLYFWLINTGIPPPPSRLSGLRVALGEMENEQSLTGVYHAVKTLAIVHHKVWGGGGRPRQLY